MREPMFRSAALVALLVLAAGCRARVPDGLGGGEPPPVVFLTDYGTADDAVAICKGVMLGLAPRLRIVDLTHQVPPFSVRDGARLLAGPTAYYPAGTVFLAVIDPGVGGVRRAIVARSRRGQYFVLPDNGLVTLVADRDGLEEVREITNPSWTLAAVRPTFHGRDVFAPVAARIARGDDWHDVGPVVEDPVRLEVERASLGAEGLTGEVVALDGRYGNLLTNVEAADFGALGWAEGDRVQVRVGPRALTLPFVRTFAEVAEGAPLLYIDSRERLALAVNRGSFAKVYRVAVPTRIFVRRKPEGRP
jgi:S-adenosylmethionine hydrolase